MINGEKTALCGGLNQPRPLIFPASGPESIFFYSDNIFTKVRHFIVQRFVMSSSLTSILKNFRSIWFLSLPLDN